MSESGEFVQEGIGFSIVGMGEEPRVCAVGCGGAGNNVIESLYWNHPGIETIAVNDDEDRLCNTSCGSAVLMKNFDDPQMSEVYSECLRSKVNNSDIVFVIAGLGGSFGARVSPQVAEAASNAGKTVVSVVISPFQAEGREESRQTVEELRRHSAATLVIDNNSVAELGEDITLQEGFELINRSISRFITAVTSTISDMVKNLNADQVDIAEELKYDIASLHEEPAGVAGSVQTEGVAQASLSNMFSLMGPATNFQLDFNI